MSDRSPGGSIRVEVGPVLRGSLAALVLLWPTPGHLVAQHCLEPRIVAGETQMVYVNLGSSTVVWLEIERDAVGSDPARLYVLGRAETPVPESDSKHDVPVEGHAVVRVPVGYNERVWLSPIEPPSASSSGGTSTSSTTTPGPTPALRYRLCFRE